MPTYAPNPLIPLTNDATRGLRTDIRARPTQQFYFSHSSLEEIIWDQEIFWLRPTMQRFVVAWRGPMLGSLTVLDLQIVQLIAVFFEDILHFDILELRKRLTL